MTNNGRGRRREAQGPVKIQVKAGRERSETVYTVQGQGNK